MNESLEVAKKRLLYRSLYRGCKETDLLLSKFARSYLANFSGDETALYEKFLDEYDGDIYNWMCGTVELPPEYQPIADKLAEACVI